MKLVIDDALGVSEPEFIAKWNSDADCLAEAVASPGEKVDDLTIDFLNAAVVTLESVTLGVLGNYAYDLIRQRVFPDKPKVVLEEITRPDGEKIVRLTVGQGSMCEPECGSTHRRTTARQAILMSSSMTVNWKHSRRQRQPCSG